MKTIGLLHGRRSVATADFYQRINNRVNELLGGHETAELLMAGVNLGVIERCIGNRPTSQAVSSTTMRPPWTISKLRSGKAAAAASMSLTLYVSTTIPRTLVRATSRRAAAPGHSARVMVRVLADDGEPSGGCRLSRREREVARPIGEGLSNAAIGRTLTVIEEPVKKYVSRILAATGYRNGTELALAVARARVHSARLHGAGA